jgi:hypothetical protein
MYKSGNILIVSLTLALAAMPASAATVSATSANFTSVFAAAKAGDTIMLSGNFDGAVLANRSFARPVRINARAAVFTGKLTVRNVDGLVVIGGVYGAANTNWQNGGTIVVSGGSNISFLQPTLIGDGAGKARGLSFQSTTGVNVDRARFSGFRMAVGIDSVTNGTFTNNFVRGATSDGFDIVNSHFVTASHNSCTASMPSIGAHADCMQLWSLAGQPVQSDISILNNYAYGQTQGFTSFDPERGGGLRITMSGNRIDTSMPQGIACYGCVDSTITWNVLTTLPGSQFRTYLRVFGGSNNIVENNSIGLIPPVSAPGGLAMAGMADMADMADSAFMPDQSFGAVPEPLVWGEMLAGLMLVGAAVRRERRTAAAA